MALKIKNIFYRGLLGANIVSVIGLIVVGYSGYFPPTDFPLLSNLEFIFPLMLLINVAFLVFWVIFRLRNIWVPCLGFVLCFSPIRTYLPINGKSHTDSQAMKVLSFNVNNFNYHDDNQIPAISKFLLEQDADVVCLQEVMGPLVKQQEFCATIKSAYPYSEMVQISSKSACMAVFSKWPILGYEIIPYQSSGNLSACFRVQSPEGVIYVINNHLESVGLSDQERNSFEDIVSGDANRDSVKSESKILVKKVMERSVIRAKQARAVAKFIHEHQGQRILCCGDFNDPPLSYTHQTVARELNDCFTDAGNGPGWTFSAHKMYFRIDNILCSDHWKATRCEVIHSEHSSDHFPIVAWLSATEKPTEKDKNDK